MAKAKPKTKGGLKAALLSHQSRASTQSRAAAAVRAHCESEKASKRNAVGHKKKSAPTSLATPRAIVSEWDNILLIGEGNFSFAASLVQHHGIPGHRLVATAYDDEVELYRKYPDARANVQVLRACGVLVLLGVDARALHKPKELRAVHERMGGFTKVVWNFPHAGAGIQDQDRNVKGNQLLVLSFLRSVAAFLAKGALPVGQRKSQPSLDGEAGDKADEGGNDVNNLSTKQRGSILITLRDTIPYTLWQVPQLARRPPGDNPIYVQIRSLAFNPDTYPGYEHRRTNGYVSGNNEDIMRPQGRKERQPSCRTWEFALKDCNSASAAR